MSLSKRTINRLSWLLAGGVMLSILGTLAVWYIQNHKPLPLSPPESETSVPQAGAESEKAQKLEKKIQESLEELAPESVQNADRPLNEEIPEEKAPQAVEDAMEKTLVEVERQAAARSPEENQNRLAHQGYLLNKVSSEESVDQIAAKVAEAQNLPPRATEPSVNPPDGPFDVDTAQIHDCEEIRNDDGSVRYVATMFDAQGRSMTVEMSETEGKQLCKTMIMIHANPIIENVYRSMVVPLLDKKISNPPSKPQEKK